MEHITIIQAGTQAHFAALSRIHALSWRAAYRGVIPQAYLDREITEDRWVPFFLEGARTGAHQGLLLLADGRPVCGGSCGPARLDAGQDGSLCAFDNRAFAAGGDHLPVHPPGGDGEGVRRAAAGGDGPASGRAGLPRLPAVCAGGEPEGQAVL